MSDVLRIFVSTQQKFSLPLLLHVHARLSVLQMRNGAVAEDDVLRSVQSFVNSLQLTKAEIIAHCAIVFESALVPSLDTEGSLILRVNKPIVASEENFISSILNIIYQKCEGVTYPSLEDFKRDASTYLESMGISRSPSAAAAVAARSVSVSSVEPQQPPLPMLPPPSALQQQQQQSLLTQPPPSITPIAVLKQQQQQSLINGSGGVQRSWHSNSSSSGGLSAAVSPTSAAAAFNRSAGRVEFEKSEPIVRLLAQLRKVGMDILFPQSTHDKILACIFVAIQSSATPAHRELIDMVMALKESNKISELEQVSKTKVRGVLALLKHGEILVPHGEMGEPVRLHLAAGIKSFKQLRERHDLFMNQYIYEHHLFVPNLLRAELVWMIDEETRKLRLSMLEDLMYKLQFFFNAFNENNAHRVEDELQTDAVKQQLQHQQMLLSAAPGTVSLAATDTAAVNVNFNREAFLAEKLASGLSTKRPSMNTASNLRPAPVYLQESNFRSAAAAVRSPSAAANAAAVPAAAVYDSMRFPKDAMQYSGKMSPHSIAPYPQVRYYYAPQQQQQQQQEKFLPADRAAMRDPYADAESSLRVYSPSADFELLRLPPEQQQQQMDPLLALSQSSHGSNSSSQKAAAAITQQLLTPRSLLSESGVGDTVVDGSMSAEMGTLTADDVLEAVAASAAVDASIALVSGSD